MGIKINEIVCDNVMLVNFGNVVVRTQGADRGIFTESLLKGPCSLLPGGHEVVADVMSRRGLRSFFMVRDRLHGGRVDSHELAVGQITEIELDIPEEAEKVKLILEGE